MQIQLDDPLMKGFGLEKSREEWRDEFGTGQEELEKT